jgi:predicted KAP-like P-loop ATPase
MDSYFNDSPIETADDDRYAVKAFADSIAKSIRGIKKPIGTAIALHGPWGSGKSSVVNLIRTALQHSNDEDLVVSDFKCWWYRGEEALALAFLQNLHAILRDGLGDKAKDLIPSIARRLLQAGPVIGQAVSLASSSPLGALLPGMSKFASTFFPEGETVENSFRKLAKLLSNQKRRFLVIIDDIDRLSPDEVLAIFRLAKSVGHLPNVMYLLVFDRELAEKIIREKYPSEGPHFLEKIVQAGFELPQPLRTDLNDAVLVSVNEICGSPDKTQIVRVMNIFYDVVSPYITTPRHVTRFRNAISVTWPAIANEVSLGDFIALETLRLYEPALFKSISQQGNRLCGTRQQGDPDSRSEARFDRFLTDVPQNRQGAAKIALQRLFPRMESVGYGGEWATRWDSERRICIETHFNTYFRLSLSDEALSSRRLDELIERANDRDFVQKAFRQAALTPRKSGKSMVPVYLSELTTHATRIKKESVQPLLSALFEIHDEIDLKKDADSGFMAMTNTSLRLHWLIRRLTGDRFSIEERSCLYLVATERAAIGWLVDFVSSAREDYRERQNGPRREEDCLVARDALEPLSERALRAIHDAASHMSLLDHKDLVYLLYRWRALCGGDAAEVRAWTDTLLRDDKALVILAHEFTGQSWSAGMGGFGTLGDRVASPSTAAKIQEDTDIIDVHAFRVGLERIRDQATMDPISLEVVRELMDAWDRERQNRRG